MTDTAQVALPASSSAPTLRRGLQASVFIFGAGLIVIVGSLLAVYIDARHLTNPWPPDDIYLDNYSSVMITITLFMGSLTAEWAARSARSMQRGVVAGLFLTSAFGAAILNSFGFVFRDLGFGMADSLYGTIVYALFIVMCISVGIASLVALMTGIRSMNERTDGGFRERIRAAASLWHVVVLVWSIIYPVLYLVK